MVLEDFHHLLAKPGKQAGTNNYCHGMDCVQEGSDDLRELHGAKVAAPGASPLSTILFSDGTLGVGNSWVLRLTGVWTLSPSLIVT